MNVTVGSIVFLLAHSPEFCKSLERSITPYVKPVYCYRGGAVYNPQSAAARVTPDLGGASEL